MTNNEDPLWFTEHVGSLSDLLTEAEHTVVALRRMLRTVNPELPDEYDGPAWQPIEEPFKP